MLGAAFASVADAVWDHATLLQIAFLGLGAVAAALFVVRRVTSRYFVVDAGFDPTGSASGRRNMPGVAAVEDQDGGDAAASSSIASPVSQSFCANECGRSATKRCTGCNRVRYCSQACQSNHWQAGHKVKCKQMKLLDGANVSCANDVKRKRSPQSSATVLAPAYRKPPKVLFPYDEFLKLYNCSGMDFVPCGLQNCGNSCFANVVLQCLSCTKPLAAYLLGGNHRRYCITKRENWCFLCELEQHVQRARDSLHPFSPTTILSRLANIGGTLGYGRQEDAHEFMRFAIDKMQSACLDEFGGEKALSPSMQETTLIQHIFGGYLQSQVKCTKCGMISNRYENMMDLTVEIQGELESLEECLIQFTNTEWLDGENKYKCDGCNDYVKACKRLTVHQAPNILTITLKRFQSGRFGKLNKRISFPLKLDLSQYMSSTDGTDLYELYAIVVHLDMLNASFFGHYICYTKDDHGCWYRIDDCKVMRIEEDEVLAQGAYMLLYSRKTARREPLIAPKEPLKEQQPSGSVVQTALNATTSNQHVSAPSKLEVSSASNGCMSAMDPQAPTNLPCEIDVRDDQKLEGVSKDAANAPGPLVLAQEMERSSSPLKSQAVVTGEDDSSTHCPALGSSIALIKSPSDGSELQCEEALVCPVSADFMEIDDEPNIGSQNHAANGGSIADSSVVMMDMSSSTDAEAKPPGVSCANAANGAHQPSSPQSKTGRSASRSENGSPQTKELFARGFLNKPSNGHNGFSNGGPAGVTEDKEKHTNFINRKASHSNGHAASTPANGSYFGSNLSDNLSPACCQESVMFSPALLTSPPVRNNQENDASHEATTSNGHRKAGAVSFAESAVPESNGWAATTCVPTPEESSTSIAADVRENGIAYHMEADERPALPDPGKVEFLKSMSGTLAGGGRLRRRFVAPEFSEDN